ncbi:MAG: type II toxin-antitoxin system VapC family toxin [Sulfuricellaceae bacterium]|nr:type II toxin-antitoxin system VapC family toxin [Sulfuricellaceae bacterium]
MLAVDTNLLVRIVANDDPEQVKRATRLFEAEQIFIPKTVWLETEWVLRYAYKLDSGVIARTLRAVAGLPNVMLENPVELALALGWFERGLDFADALHLASSQRAGRFATFDVKFAKQAEVLTEIEIIQA